MADDNVKRGLGMSRRELLRRGAVVGGTLVWATPVIQSLGSTAYAQGPQYAPHRCCQCTDPQVPGLQPCVCIVNGTPPVPPDATACSAVCTGFGYANSTFDEGPTGCTCDSTPPCAACNCN